MEKTPNKKTHRRENSAGARLERWVPKATRLDGPMRQFERALVENPDCLFMTVLEAQPEDTKFHAFLKMLVDPSTAHRTLAWKARACKVTLRELVDLLAQARNLEGLLKIGAHVPKIMEQQAEAALAKDTPCEKCKGMKVVLSNPDDPLSASVSCPDCGGAGVVRRLGNDKAIDRTLEIAGVLGKGGAGVNVNVTANVNTAAVAPIEQAVTGIGRIIDV